MDNEYLIKVLLLISASQDLMNYINKDDSHPYGMIKVSNADETLGYVIIEPHKHNYDVIGEFEKAIMKLSKLIDKYKG